MGRPLRIWEDDGTYHLFSRGSNREPIFVEQSDYFEFASIFAAAALDHRVDVFAWAFMPNHWHLVARSPREGLSPFVKKLNQTYSLRFNRRRGRTAHLFTNRFGSTQQTTQEQFLATIRYVLRNPVRAGIAPNVATASWTSYKPTVGLMPSPPFLRVGELLASFGVEGAGAVESFHSFVAADSELWKN